MKVYVSSLRCMRRVWPSTGLLTLLDTDSPLSREDGSEVAREVPHRPWAKRKCCHQWDWHKLFPGVKRQEMQRHFLAWPWPKRETYVGSISPNRPLRSPERSTRDGLSYLWKPWVYADSNSGSNSCLIACYCKALLQQNHTTSALPSLGCLGLGGLPRSHVKRLTSSAAAELLAVAKAKQSLEKDSRLAASRRLWIGRRLCGQCAAVSVVWAVRTTKSGI